MSNVIFKMARTYIRDGRSPIPVNENISKSFSGNKAKGTKPELILRKSLWSANLKGYRLNVNKLIGKPDIVFTSKRIAIFVHGCFWHRCNKCNPNFPKSNIEFWNKKFSKNIERDNHNLAQLIALNWKVIIIWECQIKKDIGAVVEAIKIDLLKS